MNEDINEVTLLSKEQVFGDNKLGIFDKFATECAVTDFAILSGAKVNDYYHIGDPSLKGRTCWWYLSSFDEFDTPNTVNFFGDCDHTHGNVRCGGIRPVLLLSNISKNSLIEEWKKGRIIEVTYGEYPQYAVDSELGKILDHELYYNRLKKTGKTYTTDLHSYDSYNVNFDARIHYEYEFQGKKYVQVKENCSDYDYRLCNGSKIRKGFWYWLEVSPIVWYFDEKSNLLISKNALASGIKFSTFGKGTVNFKETEMYMFLNKFFIKDIMLSKNNEYEKKVNNSESISNEKVNNSESIGNKIDSIYDEIVKFSEYYFGNKEYINEARSLLDKYNDNIEKIRERKNPSLYTINLTNDNLDPDYLFEKTKNDLNNLLNELKDYYETHKDHIKMLEYARKCTSILNKEEDDVSETFFNDLIKIRDIVGPYINDDSILKNIKEIFNEYENELIKYLKDDEENKVSKLKSIDEFKKDIALQMTPYLVELDKRARNNDILNDIVERYKSLSETIEKQNRNKHIMFWFDEIEKCISKIKNTGNEEDINNLDNLTKDNNFINESVDVSINKVYTLYMQVYRILLDIEDRNKFNNDLDSRRSNR